MPGTLISEPRAPARSTRLNLNRHLLSNSVFWFIGLALVTVVAFWPSYVSTQLTFPRRIHLHGLAMASWCLLLIGQAALLRLGYRQWHRRLGAVSYAVAPLVIASMASVALNDSKFRGVPIDEGFPLWFFTVTAISPLLFLVTYALAMTSRHRPTDHGRYMVCTALVFLPAITDRLFILYLGFPGSAWPPVTTLLSYSLIWAILLALAIWDRTSEPPTRHVFRRMMVIFAAFEIVPFLLSRSPFWKNVAASLYLGG